MEWNGMERNGTGSNLALIFHAAAPAKMQASESTYMQGNFVTRDSTKQRKNAYEGAEQAVTIQYNTAWVPMIPQPKQFCYHGHSTFFFVFFCFFFVFLQHLCISRLVQCNGYTNSCIS